LIGDFSFYTGCYVDMKIFSIPITIETAAIFPTPALGPPGLPTYGRHENPGLSTTMLK